MWIVGLGVVHTTVNGSNAAGEGCAYPGSWPRRGNLSLVASTVGTGLRRGSPSAGVGSGVFLLCHQGHGVSRCSRIDTSFPFLLAGWSVGVRNGRYRVAWTSMDERSYSPGKGGWSGQEGQPPGSSEIVVRLTLEGECGLGGWHPPAWQQPLGDARGSPWTPGLSHTGKPLFDEGWTAWTSGVG